VVGRLTRTRTVSASTRLTKPSSIAVPPPSASVGAPGAVLSITTLMTLLVAVLPAASVTTAR